MAEGGLVGGTADYSQLSGSFYSFTLLSRSIPYSPIFSIAAFSSDRFCFTRRNAVAIAVLVLVLQAMEQWKLRSSKRLANNDA